MPTHLLKTDGDRRDGFGRNGGGAIAARDIRFSSTISPGGKATDMPLMMVEAELIEQLSTVCA